VKTARDAPAIRDRRQAIAVGDKLFLTVPDIAGAVFLCFETLQKSRLGELPICEVWSLVSTKEQKKNEERFIQITSQTIKARALAQFLVRQNYDSAVADEIAAAWLNGADGARRKCAVLGMVRKAKILDLITPNPKRLRRLCWIRRFWI